MRLRSACDYLVYVMVRLVVCVAQALPIETCQRVAQFVAWLANDILRIRADVVDDNLQHGFPDWTAEQRRATARAMWEHLVLLVCELTHVPRKIRDTNWHRRVRLTNMEPLVAKVVVPGAIVVHKGHFGNVEVGGYMCALLGFPTHTVVRPLDNPYVDRFLTRFRLAGGQKILPKQGSATQVQELLESNGILGLLGDQAAGPKGCKADFFHRRTSCHKAIALFALVNQAPMLVTTTTRRGRPMQFEITLIGQHDPVAPVQELETPNQITQWYCELLEGAIRKAPEQYWWVHRLWKNMPENRKKRRRKAKAVATANRAERTTAAASSAVVRLPDSAEKIPRRKSA